MCLCSFYLIPHRESTLQLRFDTCAMNNWMHAPQSKSFLIASVKVDMTAADGLQVHV